jgi:hypothetical protein
MPALFGAGRPRKRGRGTGHRAGMGSVPPTAVAWGAKYLVPMVANWINLFYSKLTGRPVTGAEHE